MKCFECNKILSIVANCIKKCNDCNIEYFYHDISKKLLYVDYIFNDPPSQYSIISFDVENKTIMNNYEIINICYCELSKINAQKICNSIYKTKMLI